MVTIFNNVDRVAGDPLALVIVGIQLVWDTSISSIAKIESEDTMIRGIYGTETDDDGNWEVSLVPNDEIVPAGSLYRVTERISSTDDSVIYYIDVADSATPVFWVGDLVLDVGDLPSWL